MTKRTYREVLTECLILTTNTLSRWIIRSYNEMTEFNQLRWRCRRGMQELDVMLLRYFDHCYPQAPSLEQHLFRQLLMMEDNDLMHYFIGKAVPESDVLMGLVKKISQQSAVKTE